MQGGVAHASENGSYVYIMLWQSDLLANLWSAGMANLILLTFGNSKMVRCTDLADATAKAISYSNEEGRILVDITPEGGGPMTSLEFDRSSNDWIAAT